MHKRRNTPTCVGKTFKMGNTFSIVEKHPHMRGEDPPPAGILDARLETPPHAWGRPG